VSDLPQTMGEAQELETEIGIRAKDIRDQYAHDIGPGLTGELFLELWPLLCEPIPDAFIKSVPPTKGKPYHSTGVRSVQVQIDRMNNVLTPLWWWWEDEYHLEGKLCIVTVFVGDRNEGNRCFSDSPRNGVLLSRRSHGGVQQGSSVGNIYKGSFTNAAKPAIARVGPGREIYVGVSDLDPDVSSEAADAPPSEQRAGTIGKDIAKKLVDHAWQAGEKDRLRLAASKLAEQDVGDCGSKEKAIKALTGALTFGQGEVLDKWLSDQADKHDAEGNS